MINTSHNYLSKIYMGEQLENLAGVIMEQMEDMIELCKEWDS